MSTIDPGPVWPSTLLMIACGGGFFQSHGSTAQWIEVMPRLAAMFTTSGLHPPPGARKYLIGASGTTAWIASVVRCISPRVGSADGLRSWRSWSQVWLHSVWPSATIRLMMSALAATWRPMTQNVALMWNFASRSSTWLECAYGPSSKVSATAEVPVVLMAPDGPWPEAEELEPPGAGGDEEVPGFGGTFGPACLPGDFDRVAADDGGVGAVDAAGGGGREVEAAAATGRAE